MAPRTGAEQRVGVVGMGYVGLPLAVAFAEEGHDVVAVDVDPRKVAALRAGDSYVEDIPSDRLAAVAARIRADTGTDGLRDVDAIVICVPTPLTPNREPDLGPLVAAGEAVAAVLQPGQLVVLESTTYPGTTRERLAPMLEAGGLVAGRDFHVAFSPERVDPGRTDFTLRTTPKVVGGLTDACLERAIALYERVCDDLVRVSSPDAAELTKLLENIFRSVNIALVNELSVLCDRMGLDVWEVVDAAATKPYGFMRFDPGPGMGGHCLPVDPFYLAWRAREFDMTTKFIELAGEINQGMPYHCVSKVERALNAAGKSVNGSKVALFGVSYKPNVGDIRESPALKMIGLLRGLGAEIAYHDPHVPRVPQHDLAGSDFDAALEGADAAVIVTAHAGVPHDEVAARVPVLVDLRGVLARRPIRRAP